MKTRSKLSFYTDLDYIPLEILVAVSERLENETRNRILAKIKEKINFVSTLRKAYND